MGFAPKPELQCRGGIARMVKQLLLDGQQPTTATRVFCQKSRSRQSHIFCTGATVRVHGRAQRTILLSAQCLLHQTQRRQKAQARFRSACCAASPCVSLTSASSCETNATLLAASIVSAFQLAAKVHAAYPMCALAFKLSFRNHSYSSSYPLLCKLCTNPLGCQHRAGAG